MSDGESRTFESGTSTPTVRPRPALFRALGRHDPPSEIEVAGDLYRRSSVFKHDSWAATALYTCEADAGEQSQTKRLRRNVASYRSDDKCTQENNKSRK